MKHFLEIFQEKDIVWWYTTCRTGYNKSMLDQFICQLGIVTNHVENDVRKYKTNDRQALRMGKELLHILKTLQDAMVAPEEGVELKPLPDRLEDSIRNTARLLK